MPVKTAALQSTSGLGQVAVQSPDLCPAAPPFTLPLARESGVTPYSMNMGCGNQSVFLWTPSHFLDSEKEASNEAPMYTTVKGQDGDRHSSAENLLKPVTSIKLAQETAPVPSAWH